MPPVAPEPQMNATGARTRPEVKIVGLLARLETIEMADRTTPYEKKRRPPKCTSSPHQTSRCVSIVGIERTTADAVPTCLSKIWRRLPTCTVVRASGIC